jgi:hypothetical protein
MNTPDDRAAGRQRLTTALLGDCCSELAAKAIEIEDLREENAFLRARLRLMELRLEQRRRGR